MDSYYIVTRRDPRRYRSKILLRRTCHGGSLQVITNMVSKYEKEYSLDEKPQKQQEELPHEQLIAEISQILQTANGRIVSYTCQFLVDCGIATKIECNSVEKLTKILPSCCEEDLMDILEMLKDSLPAEDKPVIPQRITLQSPSIHDFWKFVWPILDAQGWQLVAKETGTVVGDLYKEKIIRVYRDAHDAYIAQQMANEATAKSARFSHFNASNVSLPIVSFTPPNSVRAALRMPKSYVFNSPQEIFSVIEHIPHLCTMVKMALGLRIGLLDCSCENPDYRPIDLMNLPIEDNMSGVCSTCGGCLTVEEFASRRTAANQKAKRQLKERLLKQRAAAFRNSAGSDLSRSHTIV